MRRQRPRTRSESSLPPPTPISRPTSSLSIVSQPGLSSPTRTSFQYQNGTPPLERRVSCEESATSNFSSRPSSRASTQGLGFHPTSSPRTNSLNSFNSVSGLGLTGLRVEGQNAELSRRTSISSSTASPKRTYRTQPFGPVSAFHKDPRPIREKDWQASKTRKLVNFLAHSGYPSSISPKTFQSPTTKDFQSAFKFLYQLLDPKYVFRRRFEEECPILLKELRYPLADQITKAQLYAVGSMHTWPILLGVLVWLMELVQCVEKLEPGMEYFDDPFISSPLNPRKMEEAGDEMIFKHLAKSYIAFLNGDDKFADQEKALEKWFDKKNQGLFKNVKLIEKEIQEMQEEYERLMELDSPLSTAQREYDQLRLDHRKFEDYIRHLEAKKSKYQQANEHISEELGNQEQQLERIQREKTELSDKVNSQSYKKEDVEKMERDKIHLIRTLETSQSRLIETNKLIYELEDQFSNRILKIEELLSQYNSHLFKAGLAPESAPRAKGKDFELRIVKDPDPGVVPSPKNVIKPGLIALRIEAVQTRHELEEEIISLKQQFDEKVEEVNDKEESIVELQKRLESLADNYNNEKEIANQQKHNINEELEDLQQKLSDLRIDLSSAEFEAQQRVQRAQIE
ncbi:kinetochore-associated Ndc80 complex subunit ndc80, variant 2 [Basidiobolus ranarum]|uniref:Kinetochore protein NDC80 n=1 Tax=Basidiobolus ranarum TaxID=34480 RepID=A0ABR2WUG9_9FUNG